MQNGRNYCPTKDLRRSLDYLETSSESIGTLAYLGASFGGTLGTIMTALETRFKTQFLLPAAAK